MVAAVVPGRREGGFGKLAAGHFAHVAFRGRDNHLEPGISFEGAGVTIVVGLRIMRFPKAEESGSNAAQRTGRNIFRTILIPFLPLIKLASLSRTANTSHHDDNLPEARRPLAPEVEQKISA